MEISPNNKFLYVLMESGNRLCTYAIDPTVRTTTNHPPNFLYPNLKITH